MVRPPTLLWPVRAGDSVHPSRGSGTRRGSSSGSSHSVGRRGTRRRTNSLAARARSAAITIWIARPGALPRTRPIGRRATSASDAPTAAMTTRTIVSSRTYQARGIKKEGRKCRSSQDCLAAAAQTTSTAPTIAVAISTVGLPGEDRAERDNPLCYWSVLAESARPQGGHETHEITNHENFDMFREYRGFVIFVARETGPNSAKP